jgi:protocatechuate 3,4-dioxygenase beta subunit
MDEEIRRSRERISRRRALGLGGTIGLGALVTACTGSSRSEAGAPAPSLSASSTAPSDVLSLLDQANTCVAAQEETQGPYWFDVDSIRSDLREDRPGTPLVLAVRAHDLSQCTKGSAPTAIPNSVMEIWHCDAGGVYSGFESASQGGPGGGGSGDGGGPAGGGPGGDGGPGGGGSGDGSGDTSNGSYSVGDSEANPTDDGTYLRGAQVADRNGVVQFTTIYPGWYQGRTVHIHLKLHVDRKTVLTTQLYFDEAVNDAAFATAPYDKHTGRETRNEDDSIYDPSGLVTVRRTASGYLGVINVGVNASAA